MSLAPILAQASARSLLPWTLICLQAGRVLGAVVGLAHGCQVEDKVRLGLGEEGLDGVGQQTSSLRASTP